MEGEGGVRLGNGKWPGGEVGKGEKGSYEERSGIFLFSFYVSLHHTHIFSQGLNWYLYPGVFFT